MPICFNDINNKLGLYRIRNLNITNDVTLNQHCILLSTLPEWIIKVKYRNIKEIQLSCPSPLKNPFLLNSLFYIHKIWHICQFVIHGRNGNIKEIPKKKLCINPPNPCFQYFLFINPLSPAPTISSKWNISNTENTNCIPMVVPPPLHLPLHDQ